MRRFNNKLFIFISIVILLPVIMMVTGDMLSGRRIDQLSVEDSYDIVFSGDSHIQSGINPRFIIYSNAVNIAKGTEHYQLTYLKTKLFIEKTSFNTLVIDFSPHNLSAFTDNALYGETSMEMLDRYFSIIDLRTKLKILYHIPFISMRLIPRFIEQYIQIIRTDDIFSLPFYGQFHDSRETNLTDRMIIDAYTEHYVDRDGNIYGFSDEQIKYLKKTIDLCREHDIEIIFISPPVYRKYYEMIPDTFMKGYEYYRQYFSEEYNVHTINMLDFRFPSDYYGDADHLNSRGARWFTEYIEDSLIHLNNSGDQY